MAEIRVLSPPQILNSNLKTEIIFIGYTVYLKSSQTDLLPKEVTLNSKENSTS